jgi:hypothetical protein
MTKFIYELVLSTTVEGSVNQILITGGCFMPAKIYVTEIEFAKDSQILRWQELCDKYGISWTTAKSLKKRLGLTTGKKEDRKIVYEVDGDGCWICTSHKTNTHGYPQGNANKGRRSIAKVMWCEKNGIWPDGAVMVHSCDNRLCINPEHISPGTRKINSGDMADKDRSCWGWRNGIRKLTPKQAQEIFGLKTSGLSQRKVGELYSVNGATVWYIWNGLTWWRDNSGVENFKVPLNKTLVGKKLKLREVESIMSLKGKVSMRRAAKIYRVSHETINKIWNHKSWKGIGDGDE